MLNSECSIINAAFGTSSRPISIYYSTLCCSLFFSSFLLPYLLISTCKLSSVLLRSLLIPCMCFSFLLRFLVVYLLCICLHLCLFVYCFLSLLLLLFVMLSFSFSLVLSLRLLLYVHARILHCYV
jgi:hypothetical protein